MTASNLSRRTFVAALALSTIVTLASVAEAARYGRHYYGGWSYQPQRSYYYTSYYYKPAPSYTTYSYHYCIYYPSRPRYVYYYNPVRRVYWGRYDLEEKGYSKLADKDQKADLKDIAESAFPKPGEMPAIPESTDGEKMLPIDPQTLPQEKAPDDTPAK